MRGIRPALDPRLFRNLPVLSRSWPTSEIGFGIRPAAGQSPKWVSGFVPQLVKVRNGFRDLSRSGSKSDMGCGVLYRCMSKMEIVLGALSRRLSKLVNRFPDWPRRIDLWTQLRMPMSFRPQFWLAGGVQRIVYSGPDILYIGRSQSAWGRYWKVLHAFDAGLEGMEDLQQCANTLDFWKRSAHTTHVWVYPFIHICVYIYMYIHAKFHIHAYV